MRNRVQRYRDRASKFFKQIGRIRAYRRVFASKDGKTVLNDLMRSFNPLKISYTQCPRKTAYLEGQRSVIIGIIRVLNIEDEVIFKELRKLKIEKKGGTYGRQTEQSTLRTGLFEPRSADK